MKMINYSIKRYAGIIDFQIAGVRQDRIFTGKKLMKVLPEESMARCNIESGRVKRGKILDVKVESINHGNIEKGGNNRRSRQNVYGRSNNKWIVYSTV